MEKNVYEFISKQTGDPIVEWKTCAVSGKTFAIFQSDVDFYEKISPTFNGVKYQIPTPTLCPEERQRRKMIFRNERKLYRRECRATNKEIISIYSPDKEYIIYDQQFRRSDAWNPLDFGISFDFNKSCFLQFYDLIKKVPLISLININPENSLYCNYADSLKNCYLEVGGVGCENVYYSHTSIHCQNCCDNYLTNNCNNCYQISSCECCNNLFYSSFCKNCHNSSYLIDCQNCNFCFACIGLINKKYYIFNKKYSPEEYEKKINELQKTGDIEEIFEEFTQKSIFNHARIFHSENVFGDNIKYSKESSFVYDVFWDENTPIGVENSKHLFITGYGTYDTYDAIQSGINIHWCNEIISGYSNINNILFCCGTVDNCHHLTYCYQCYASKDCFACIGLRNKQYCILNKQYTKEEYEQLIPQIIEKMIINGERGEFFHPSISPFGYNETAAMEYFPLSKEEALARGYKRQHNNYDPTIPTGAKVIKSYEIESLESDEAILKSIFICETSGRPFKIIKQELEFYKKHHIPLPTKHPDIRHAERLAKRPGREFYLRTCDQCGIEMLSVYKKEEPFKVFCEQCYNKEIYG